MSWALLLLIALIMIPGTSEASTGLLEGDVRSRPYDVAVQGATVVVLATGLHAVTDARGRFQLPIVMTGLHRVRVHAAGYGERLIEDVAIWPERTTTVTITMSPDSEPADAGSEPAAVIDHANELGTTRQVESRELSRLPVEGVPEVATLLPGVAGVRSALLRTGSSDRALSIRGASPFETAWSVDGRTQSLPAVTSMRGEIPGPALGAVAVTNGGLGAGFAGVSSGIVHVLVREPGPANRGTAGVATDAVSGDWIGAGQYGQNTYETSFEGPWVAGSERGGFLLTASRRWNRDRLPRYVAGNLVDEFRGNLGPNFDGGRQPGNSLSGWNWLGRTSWRPADPVGLDLRVQGSQDGWREFTQAYLFDAEHMPRHEDRSAGGDASLHVMHGPDRLIDLSVGYAFSDQRFGDGAFFDDLRAYGSTGGDPGFDFNVPYFYLPGHVHGLYQRRNAASWRLETGIVQQWGATHQLKAGLQAERGTLRLYEGLPATFLYGPGGSLVGGVYSGYGFDGFARGESGDGLGPARHPTTRSAYVQDRFTWSRMVMRGGLRLDSFDTDGRVSDPLTGAVLTSERVTRLSPRVDATWSHGGQLEFRASAGQSHQSPHYLVSPLGAPIQRANAVELGVAHRSANGLRVDACAYSKAVRDFVDVAAPRADPGNRVPFASSATGDATFKGLELQARLETGAGRVAWASYTLSSSSGEFDVPGQASIPWTGTSPPRFSRPLSSDQRHRMLLGADLGLGRGEGPRLLGRRPFEMSNLNLVVRLASGTPYTPTTVYDAVTLAIAAVQPTGSVHSSATPWTSTVDLRAGRVLHWVWMKLDASLTVLNLLDRKNAEIVYSGTDSPYNTGFLATAEGQAYIGQAASQGIDGERIYRLAQSRPTLFAGPRQVRFVMEAAF